MFKSTTVAVESFNKSCLIDEEKTQNIAEQDTESEITWPYRGKAKKQTVRRKIAFSFSFPKRASLKLESSAAVFCESAEEKKLIKYDTEIRTQESSTKSSLNDAMPASDLCAFLVYSENRAVSPTRHLSTVPGSSAPGLNSEECGKAENKADSSQEESAMSDAPQTTSGDANSFQSQEKDGACLRRPSQPFLSVMGRDAKTIFQWPSEMVCTTKTEPSIPFSCNPLHFDFRGSQFRKSPSNSKNDQELSFISEKSPRTSSLSCEVSSEETTCRIERNIRQCHLHSSRAHSKPRRGKSRAQSSKTAEDKLQGRNRRHCRSQHKKRHKRRRRWEEEGHDETQQSANMKKWTKLRKRGGFKSQFRGCAAQQEQPLEKSKQSAQNQAEKNGAVPAAGGSDGAQRGLDDSGGMVDVSLGQTTITQNDSHRLSRTPSDRQTSAPDHSSPTIPKKRQSEAQSSEEEVWSDPAECGMSAEIGREKEALCLNHGQKRQKMDQSPGSHLSAEHPLLVISGSKGTADVDSAWKIVGLKAPGPRDPKGESAAAEASHNKNPTSSSEINSETLPKRELQGKDIQHPPVQTDPAPEQEPGNKCTQCAAPSQVKEREKVSHDKSCQHTPPLPGLQHLDEAKNSCTIPSAFNPMLCFTSRLSGVERHGLLHGHTHKQVLHQKGFSAKLRSTLPMSSPLLHPVHLPSAIPSSSITILQHHSTFLPTQHSLFTQVLPVTRLSLAPEITPFIPSSQVSMVAPPTIQTTAVTFHTLPGPQVFRPLLHPPAHFPPLLPPHTTVIPLQPLF